MTKNTLGRYTQYANKVGFSDHAKVMAHAAHAKSVLTPNPMWDYYRNTHTHPTPFLQRHEVQVYDDSDNLKALLPLRVQYIHHDESQYQTDLYLGGHIKAGVVVFIANGTAYVVPLIEYFGDCPHITLYPYQHETLPVSEAFQHNGDTTSELDYLIERITPIRDAERIANQRYDEEYAYHEESALERIREEYDDQKRLVRRFIKAIRTNNPPTSNATDAYMGDNAATYRELETALYHRDEQAKSLSIARKYGYYEAYGSLY